MAPGSLRSKLQDVIAASVAPDRLILFAPAVAVMVPPPHEPVSPFGVATTRPGGRLSVNATPVSTSAVFMLPMVKLRLVLALSWMDAAPNILVTVGGNVTR